MNKTNHKNLKTNKITALFSTAPTAPTAPTAVGSVGSVGSFNTVNPVNPVNPLTALTALTALSLLFSLSVSFFIANDARAALVSPAQAPLDTSAGLAAKPNIMFMLDESGSMAWDFLGDGVGFNSDCKNYAYSTFSAKCTAYDSSNLGNSAYAEPPFRLYTYNLIAYNPNIRYIPGVDYLGATLGNQSITSAKRDIFSGSTTTDNISTQSKETIWCSTSTPSELDKGNLAICKRNGIQVVTGSLAPDGSFDYQAQAFPGKVSGNNYNNQIVTTTINGVPVTPFYFRPVIREYCTDVNLGTCTFSSTPVTILAKSYNFPATNRYCNTKADAAATTIITGTGVYSGRTQPRCQKNIDPDHQYARFPLMARVDLNLLNAPFTTSTERNDCAAAPSCTLAEEQINYANWYTFYRIRIEMVKSAGGIAFKTLDNTKRVGFITINPGNPVSSNKFLAINDFTISQKQAWYAKFYSQTPTGSTPMRESFTRVGRYFAGKTTGINQGMIGGSNLDPVQYSCQQNYLILTTDGYWNGAGGQDLSGNPLGNYDNIDGGYSKRADGAYDGNVGGASNTLADAAMYYYSTDLRPPGTLGQGGVDVSADNVPITINDNNTQQHMNTFTMGLGLTGYVTFNQNYLKPGYSLEYDKIKSGATGCPWADGICNWPLPIADSPSALDDLWHAAVNGRGQFFSASNPQAVISGLRTALTGVAAATGSAAAAATSSPNITPTNNFLYYSTYRTNYWDGEIAAKTIDANTGAVSVSNLWSARALLTAKATPNTDTRTIYTNGGGTLKPFLWGSLTLSEQTYFAGKCSSGALSQCVTMNLTQKAVGDSGQNLTDYLRGQNQYESKSPNVYQNFRARDFILGDTVNAAPVFMGPPIYNWGDVGYSAFKNANTTRTSTLFVASNDGMLHALDANTGQELWAFVPKSVFPNLYALADVNYNSGHRYFVDGTPTVTDVNIGGTWKTILIGGLGAGGRGWYALDVTNPNSPSMLWEMCTDATLCSVADNDIGLSYGNPVVLKRKFDGKWTAYLSSGYDNVTPGTGLGFLYEVDIVTGSILRKINTFSGTVVNPSGLTRLNAWFDNLYLDATSDTIYGTDLNGDTWSFDLGSSSTTTTRLGHAQDAAGNPQPITTKPELGLVGTSRVVFVATGKYLSTADFSATPAPWAYQQSVYAFKDTKSDLGVLRNRSDIVQQVVTPGSTTASVTKNTVDWTTKNGWFFDLGASPGERVNIDPLLTLGTLNVLSNVPGTNVCTTGGITWYYQIDYLTGSYIPTAPGVTTIATKLTGSMAVGQVVSELSGSGGLRNFITNGNGTVISQGVNTNNSSNSSRKTSWRQITR